MNTVRTVIVVAVLAAVAYGVHASLTAAPPADPPGLEPGDWSQAPMVEIPSSPSTVTLPTAAPSSSPPISGSAVPFSPPAATTSPLVSEAGEAPPFAAPVVSGGNELAPPFAPPATRAPASAAPPETAAVPAAVSVTPSGPDDVALPVESSATVAAVQSEVPPMTSTPASNAPVARDLTETSTPPNDRYASPSTDGGMSEFETSLKEWTEELDRGNLAEAHLALSQWYGDPRMSEEQRTSLLDLLDRVAGTVVYSQQSLLEPAYEVQPGDTLERIGQMYNVPWQLLAKINGVSDPQRIRAGQMLKVVRGPFSAAVELDRYMLTLWLDGRYAGRFPVGVGQDSSTPEGEFIVRGKVENPTYYGPDQVIDADDPNNPLGERWIDLGNQIGIHGTHDPNTVGQAASRGCIRLKPRDVEDVFDILSVGSTIIIRR